jgi:hypothetical protein
MIWAFIGPEGSGKTLCMSFFDLLHISEGGTVQTFPGFKLQKPNGDLLSTEINFRTFFTDLPKYKGVIINGDEIQNFADSYMHMSVFSRLLYYAGAQRRKANFGLTYTVQDWGWVHPRIRTLTHLATFCKDLHFSPWGKDNSIKQGEMISMATYDLKGFFTGTPWTLMSRKTLMSKPIWNWYDTYAAVDIFEGMRKYEIRKETEIFDLRPPKDESDEPPSPEDIITPPIDLLEKLANQGVDPRTLAQLGRRLQQ